jgi:hypothetical protein
LSGTAFDDRLEADDIGRGNLLGVAARSRRRDAAVEQDLNRLHRSPGFVQRPAGFVANLFAELRDAEQLVDRCKGKKRNHAQPIREFNRG